MTNLVCKWIRTLYHAVFNILLAKSGYNCDTKNLDKYMLTAYLDSSFSTSTTSHEDESSVGDITSPSFFSEAPITTMSYPARANCLCPNVGPFYYSYPEQWRYGERYVLLVLLTTERYPSESSPGDILTSV